MSQQAYIKLVGASTVQSMTLHELKDQLLHYREQFVQTGQQLDWSYADAAFRYTIEEQPDGKDQWFYLKGINPLYRYIVMGIEKTGTEDEEKYAIQVVLPEGSTIGDKSKGNEFCKYLGKIFKGEVHLFNKRIMYFYPRK